jgi:hypothetical protein
MTTLWHIQNEFSIDRNRKKKEQQVIQFGQCVWKLVKFTEESSLSRWLLRATEEFTSERKNSKDSR